MKLYGEDEYGKAVDYAQKYSLKLEENKRMQHRILKSVWLLRIIIRRHFIKMYMLLAKTHKIVTDGTEYGRCTKRMGKCPP